MTLTVEAAPPYRLKGVGALSSTERVQAPLDRASAKLPSYLRADVLGDIEDLASESIPSDRINFRRPA
jgi:hypothetical protein